MFKNFATSIFARRACTENGCKGAPRMTQSELQDLFRSEFEVHDRSAAEIMARHANRRPQAFAA